MINLRWVCSFVLVISLFIFLDSCKSEKLKSNSLENDLEAMLTWFPGEYDNDKQIKDLKAKKTPDSLMQRHTHHLFQPVEVNFTEHKTLYAQQYQHYDPEDIYRQRIYAFDIDSLEQAISLTIYTPKDPASIRDLHLNKELQTSLVADDFILKPGCEVYWKRVGEEYQGYLKKNACNYFSTRFGKQVFLNETLTLRKDALLLHDRAVDEDGNSVFGSADRGPTINIKL